MSLSRYLFPVTCALALGLAAVPASARDDVLRIYIDADFTIATETATSISHGLRSALSTQDFEAAGYALDVVELDHRNNARRSISNLRRFDEDVEGIAVIGGMHSPPYIQHLDEINDSEIPLLLAWSAGQVLTRGAFGSENWVFRLSVDDGLAGGFIANRMVSAGCDRIGLLVLDNPWGLANRATFNAALHELGIPPEWSGIMPAEMGPTHTSQIADQIEAADLDCVGLVGISVNSALVLNALAYTSSRPRVFSHWGLLSGTFAQDVPHPMRTAVDLHVLQTCGLDPERRNEARLRQALDAAARLGWVYEELNDIPTPAGFVHGFDLGLVLMAAIEQAAESEDWSDDPEMRRIVLRDTLENLDGEIAGILRTYQDPFDPVTENDMDGHEALSSDDLCLATFDETGLLVHAEMSPSGTE